MVPTDRPTFPLILSQLKTLASSSNTHIVLKTSKDELTPGYVSENGQVFLHYIPPYIFQSGLPARRYSNPVSSADDTIYSRETAESLLYLCSSEVESTYTTRETDEEEEGEGKSQWEEVETEGGEGEGDRLLRARRGEANLDPNSQESHDEDRDGSREKLVYF